MISCYSAVLDRQFHLELGTAVDLHIFIVIVDQLHQLYLVKSTMLIMLRADWPAAFILLTVNVLLVSKLLVVDNYE